MVRLLTQEPAQPDLLNTRGETRRQRNAGGDLVLALDDFNAAIRSGHEPAATHRSLGQQGFQFEFSSIRKSDEVQLRGIGWGAVRNGELFVITYTAPGFFPPQDRQRHGHRQVGPRLRLRRRTGAVSAARR